MIHIRYKNGELEHIESMSKLDLIHNLNNLIQKSSSIENIDILPDNIIDESLAKKITYSIIKESKINNTIIINNINTLISLLDDITIKNKFFNIGFLKKSGELRVINGIPHNYTKVKGTGSYKQSSSYIRKNHNIFQCYEVQITNLEQLIKELQNETSKDIGFKRIKIENIQWITVDKTKYMVKII